MTRRFLPVVPAFIMIGGSLFTALLAIDISPSKYQGGTSNAQPYQTQGSPSLFSAPFKWIFGEGHSEAMKRVQAPPNFKADLQIEPKDFMAISNSILRVRMIAINQGKDKFLLEFPTAQHFEFSIQDTSGREMYRWSCNKEFVQKPSSILVNPSLKNRPEQLVYEEEIFSMSNQVAVLPAGEYKMRGEITSKTPISVESTFRVSAK